ncbi:hypothetical protein [Pseudactinotalea suaedae]|jgi:hypothetical protein|uniref:hypothetical protein n=1 Tax=Pseudactinotalea suaedae TaxID=1524924 RepID=UPI0012E1BC5E|nr:hypothetical protein [Pseudactinotalea suaedae]
MREAVRQESARERERSREARLAAAQRALATAEASTGLRQRLTGVTTLASAASGPVPPPSSTVPPELLLPLPAGVETLLPWGGLRRGSAIQVSGSRSVLLALAAAAANAPGLDLWCAVVAMPDVGLAAAAEAGLDLNRTVVVPKPGPDAPAVLGALIDGFDVVVLGRCPALTDADRRSAGHRLRHREAVLLSGDVWPGAHAVLEVGERSWFGVGAGDGVLTGREATITGYARGLGQPRQVRVRMGADGDLAPIGVDARLSQGEGEIHELDLARAG